MRIHKKELQIANCKMQIENWTLESVAVIGVEPAFQFTI